MSNVPYLSLIMLKGINVYNDMYSGNRAFNNERKINASVLAEATKHKCFGNYLTRMTIKYAPLSLSHLVMNFVEPGMPERFAQRNTVVFNEFQNAMDDETDRDYNAKISIIEPGAGIDWRLGNEMLKYKSRIAGHTIGDLACVAETRKKIFKKCIRNKTLKVFPANHIDADFNKQEDRQRFIGALPKADAHIVLSKGFNPYLNLEAYNGLYSGISQLPNVTVIGTYFHQVGGKNGTYDKGKIHAKFVDYQSAIPDEEFQQNAKDNGFDVIKVYKPSEWLSFPGMDRKTIDSVPNLERIFVMKNNGPQ